jgi:hypothetical protein
MLTWKYTADGSALMEAAARMCRRHSGVQRTAGPMLIEKQLLRYQIKPLNLEPLEPLTF